MQDHPPVGESSIVQVASANAPLMAARAPCPGRSYL
jgi:hypothetical protein